MRIIFNTVNRNINLNVFIIQFETAEWELLHVKICIRNRENYILLYTTHENGINNNYLED